jgi:hypothetical protein
MNKWQWNKITTSTVANLSIVGMFIRDQHRRFHIYEIAHTSLLRISSIMKYGTTPMTGQSKSYKTGIADWL